MYAAKPESGSDIDDAAAAWAARVDRGALSAAETQQFDAWLETDPRRSGAFARAKAVLAHFDRAKALGDRFDPADFASAPAVRSSNKWIGWIGALAAALVLAVASALYLTFAPERFSTALGEVRLVSLPDGSRLTLNTASTVAVYYSGNERRVELTVGEALFTVAKDVTRPFVVEAYGTRVRALGTRFTVRRLQDESVRVLVSEGVVEVTRSETAVPAAPVRLTANTRAYAVPREPVKVAAISNAEVARELAWREGMISFAGITLGEAAQEFARYSDVRIVFEEPRLAERTVTGLFASNNPLGFAKAIATSMNLAVEVRPKAVHVKSHP